MTDRFVARNSPVRLALMVLGAAGFVVLGLWIVGAFGVPPSPNRIWAGWLAILFFGFAAFKGVSRMLGPGDQIVIDRNGVFFRHWSEMTIPWSAIRTYESQSVRRQRFVCLYLKNPSQFPRAGAGARLGGLNKGMGFGDVTLSAQGTDQSFDALFAAIERYAPAGAEKEGGAT